MIEQPNAAGQPFWTKGWVWFALALLSLVPFLAVTVVPFNDLPNHVGRHYVFLHADDPFLARYYTVHWSLIGNLGIDLIVRAIGPWLGADLATHLAVATIPPLTIAGIYALSRAYHNTVQPGALAALPLALSWPLITGFANFCLSAALALLVLALWIRLRALHFLLRLLIFAPLGFVVWVAHTAGWGVLCLGVGSYELARAIHPRLNIRALLLSPLQALPFALMLVPILAWRSGAGNGAAIGFGDQFLRGKVLAVVSLFREHFMAWDVSTTLAFAALVLFFFLRGGRRVAFTAALTAVIFVVAFLACPQEIFKSGYADRRLLPYAAMLVALAIGVRRDLLGDRFLRAGAVAAVLLFGARVAVTTGVWSRASAAHERRLALIDAVPRHSRIFALDIERCGEDWNRVGRPDHIQQFALVRRAAMVNGMYRNPGLNQVDIRFARDGGFDPNMYPTVHDARCPVVYIPLTFQDAMRAFPRDFYDYVWIVADEPQPPADTRGLRLIGTSGFDRLYRIGAR